MEVALRNFFDKLRVEKALEGLFFKLREDPRDDGTLGGVSFREG